MNYYNPYFYSFPMGTQAVRSGLLSRILGGRTLSFSNILNGTQRVLNIANQTIPLVKQAKPIFGNVKTMFKVMNEFKKNDKNNNIENTIGPTFFE